MRDNDAHRQANREFMRRHFCRLDPWPAVLDYAGFGQDVYRSKWGPSEFTCSGTLAEWDVTAQLDEVTVPTLLLSGRHNEITAPLQEELQRGIPRTRRVTFQDSAHTSHLEEPERFDAALLDFLAEVDAEGDARG